MNCTFDDRMDAHFEVKDWLQSHSPSEFTLNNMRRLLRDMVQKEVEPVDDIRGEYQERTIGMLRGILEYSREQAEAVVQLQPSLCLTNAVAGLRDAMEMLPRASRSATVHIQEAVSNMGSDSGIALERSRQAASLACMLLGRTSTA